MPHWLLGSWTHFVDAGTPHSKTVKRTKTSEREGRWWTLLQCRTKTAVHIWKRPYCPQWQVIFWCRLPGSAYQGWFVLVALLTANEPLQGSNGIEPRSLALGDLGLVVLFRISEWLFCSHMSGRTVPKEELPPLFRNNVSNQPRCESVLSFWKLDKRTEIMCLRKEITATMHPNPT